MSVLHLPRLHFQGKARIHAPTGYKNGLVDIGNNTCYMNGVPYQENHSASEYHEYLYNKGLLFNAEGKLDENGPFSMAQGWNFGGNGHFSIDAQIISTQREFGKVDKNDPVIGRSVDFWGHYNEYVKTTFNRARIFENDPASNWTNTIMLGQLAFGRLGDSNQVPYMVTAPIQGYQLARWQDFDYIRDLPEHILNHEFGKAAVYQFAISKGEEDFLWNDEANISPTVSLLREAMQREDVLGLVVQFSISNMSAPIQPDCPSFWELHGSIGLWCKDELKTYPGGRLLTPQPESKAMGNLTLSLNPQGISVNMITAIPNVGRSLYISDNGIHSPDSKLDLGDLEIRTVDSNRLVGIIPSCLYKKEAHDLTSGLVDIPYVENQDWQDLREDVENQGLCIIGTVAGERRVLVKEKEINLQVDDACLFVEFPNFSKGEDNTVEIEVRSFVRGVPQSVSVYVNQFYNPRAFPQLRYQFERERNNDENINTKFHYPRNSELQIVGLKPGRILDKDKGDFNSSCNLTTNKQGRGWFTLRGAKSGTCKILISSSLNEISRGYDNLDEAEITYDNDNKLRFWNTSGFLAVRVMGDDWHLDDIPQEDVDFNLIYEHVLSFYEASFSFMKAEVFSLADKCKVATYARLMWQMSDPKNKHKTYYMPPTRDMSESQSKLLLKFLQNQQQIGYIPPSEQKQPQQYQDKYQIKTKEELIKALKQAAELEVAVMLQYIYAGYSVPNYVTGEEYVRRGLWTEEQLHLACGDGKEVDNYGMRGVLMEIAREEMIHFLLVNNILMAIGEPFYPAVPDFKQLNAKFPIDIDFALEPLNALSLQYFMRLEMPDFLNETLVDETIPTSEQLHTYGSLSELYGQIRDGLENIPDLFKVDKNKVGGEHRLFMRDNLNQKHPDYQMQVYDVKSALFAVDVIVEHGEGSQIETETFARSHYQRFRQLASALSQEQICANNKNQSRNGIVKTWNPSYPSLRNPSLNHQDCNSNVVTVPQTRTVMEIFNESYFLMMQLMVQHFNANPQGSLRRSKLMNASIDVMTGMMRPLGELLMTLPSGKRGKTAGPSFEIPTPEYIPSAKIAASTISNQFEDLAKRSHSCKVIPEAVSEMFDFYKNFFEHGLNG
ncbi:MAG: ferritin-like domain-containing protein [Rivularia sp. (in: cyanobacteria)]